MNLAGSFSKSLVFNVCMLFVFCLIVPLIENLLGLKRKANNNYFEFILQVLQVGKQFATANSLFIFKVIYFPNCSHILIIIWQRYQSLLGWGCHVGWSLNLLPSLGRDTCLGVSCGLVLHSTYSWQRYQSLLGGGGVSCGLVTQPITHSWSRLHSFWHRYQSLP